jgi:hypothetical protein
MQTIKNLIIGAILIGALLIGFAEPTAELLPFQILVWAGVVGFIYVKGVRYAN